MLDVVYRDARGRLIELVGALTGEQLRTPVPATSAWTVHELVAHLVGGPRTPRPADSMGRRAMSGRPVMWPSAGNDRCGSCSPSGSSSVRQSS